MVRRSCSTSSNHDARALVIFETRSGLLRGQVVAFEGVAYDVEELGGWRGGFDAFGLGGACDVVEIFGVVF